MYGDSSDAIECRKIPRDKFWLDEPSILYSNSNFTTFIPEYDMSRNQQLNAMTRFGIYMAILVIAFGRSEGWLLIAVLIIVFAILLNRSRAFDKLWPNKELYKEFGIRQEIIDHKRELADIEYKHDNDKKLKTYSELDKADIANKNAIYEVKTGYYDSDEKMVLGTKEYPNECLRPGIDSLYTVDELIEEKLNTCKRPTSDNPMMNLSAVDHGNQNVPAACNANDSEIQNDIKINFNKDLFRNVDELWEKENSQRQFYTMPNTAVPNNQKEFAEWLYKMPTSNICKEDQYACLRYDDLRVRTI